MKRTRVIIMGAAGRDFHNFNTVFRADDRYEVVAFTATQIPTSMGEVSGRTCRCIYPNGIPIFPDRNDAPHQRIHIDEVIFAYSDVPFQYVMSKQHCDGGRCRFQSSGCTADHVESKVPVIAVVAVRTGSAKAKPRARFVNCYAQQKTRCGNPHPMPYGDLVKQKVQRYSR